MRNNDLVIEIVEIIKQMSTENQQYFLTLVRVAAVAENAVRENYYNKEKQSDLNCLDDK